MWPKLGKPIYKKAKGVRPSIGLSIPIPTLLKVNSFLASGYTNGVLPSTS